MRAASVTLLTLLLAGVPAWSQPATAPAAPDQAAIEIMFWSAAQHGQGAAGYRAYLMLYPNGKFASLARLRAGDQTPPPDPYSPYRLSALPYVAPYGTPTRIVCTGFGEPALFDWLVVVPSGAADFDPANGKGNSVYIALAHIDRCAGAGLLLPVFPAGSYEARYLSRTSTPDGQLRVLARVGFLAQ